jgi:hypothetical protein
MKLAIEERTVEAAENDNLNCVHFSQSLPIAAMKEGTCNG